MKIRIGLSYTAVMLCIVFAAPAAYAGRELGFSKSFTPDTVGPGSISTLTFVITNPGALPVRDLAFTDVLPAGVTIATPANVNSNCGGTVTAPDGGGTITLSDGGVGAAMTCTISVDVTSSTHGTHQNVTGDLTSAAGNSAPASADLTVDVGRPGFTKSFSPSSVPFGSRSTLTFTIDNMANPDDAAMLAFTDQLPPGMVVASPGNASTNCAGGTLTAASGGNVIIYTPLFLGDASVGAGASCTITVDVLGDAVGLLGNTTGELASASGFGFPQRSSGKAGAILSVFNDQISLVKKFTDDPVPPGGTVTLEFTVRNMDRSSAATNIDFTDDLDAALAGLTALGLPLNDPCGRGSTLIGTSVLTLTGGNLAPEQSCTFAVTLQLPVGAASGVYTNTTSAITAELQGKPFTGHPATDILFVSPTPLLSKDFLVNPATAGGTTDLEFTITNTSSTSDATDITFADEFDSIFPTASAIPTGGFCGPGSTAHFTPLIDIPQDGVQPARLSVSGASLAPGESCAFTITLDVALDASSGTYANTTSDISATIDGQTVTGDPGTDGLFVLGAPRLTKEFIDDPVAPAGTATLRFTLSHGDGENAFGDATDITFSDDLSLVLAGLSAIGLPVSDICGAGSQLSGHDYLTLHGGSLAADESCTFDVTVQIPGTALPGIYTNTTSNVVATIGGLTTAGPGATDDLNVAGLELTKSFVDDPVIAGDTVTLEFTIANTSAIFDATDIFFTDDLGHVVAGLAATGLPLLDVCGAGSLLAGMAGNTFLAFHDGSLTPGSSCTFSVTLDVPPETQSDTYANTTSDLMATIDGSPLFLKPATDTLTVSSRLLLLEKEFTDDPVVAGRNVNLRFTVTNLDATRAASGIAFTDNLDSALAGLVSVSGALDDVCGPGSRIDGDTILTFTGGNLAAGASCSFEVSLAVPLQIPPGTQPTNTTSEGTGVMNGLAVTADPAHDDLQIEFSTFTKAFDGSVLPGGTSSLTFTIQNLSTNAVQDLTFSDDLASVVPGLAAANLPAVDVCGAGSVLDGTSFLTLTGGNLLANDRPGAVCMFTVELQVPGSAVPGSYVNTTSDLMQAGLPLAAPATDTLVVEPIVDRDNDGVHDNQDNCPDDANPGQEDAELDGIGDVCDPDDDNDGTFDVNDGCPLDANKVARGTCGCGVPDGDRDRDGVADCIDVCPDTMGSSVNGCPRRNTDADGDGVSDPDDLCPNTEAGVEVDVDGCQIDEPEPQPLDTDGDGVVDADDECPDTEDGAQVDDVGCPIDEPEPQPLDTDGDGVVDADDECPDTEDGAQVDDVGCPIDEPAPQPLDSDGDGVADADDQCPDTPESETVDADGCPLTDDGTDGTGQARCGLCGTFGMIPWMFMFMGFFLLKATKRRPT